MSKLEEAKELLYAENASLVVCYSNGVIRDYHQNRVNDIKDILREDRNALKGAVVADKVIGKLAASLLAVAGVQAIYADVISEYAIPVLNENGIEFEYKTKVEYIINNDKTGMCPMENRFKDEEDIFKIFEEVIGS